MNLSTQLISFVWTITHLIRFRRVPAPASNRGRKKLPTTPPLSRLEFELARLKLKQTVHARSREPVHNDQVEIRIFRTGARVNGEPDVADGSVKTPDELLGNEERNAPGLQLDQQGFAPQTMDEAGAGRTGPTSTSGSPFTRAPNPEIHRGLAATVAQATTLRRELTTELL